jgi:uncharacterized repeat protein (TIGR02543 family)
MFPRLHISRPISCHRCSCKPNLGNAFSCVPDAIRTLLTLQDGQFREANQTARDYQLVTPEGEQMRGLHFDQNLFATFGRKLTVILAMAGLMAVNLGPLEARAADEVVNCTSGTFTISDSGSQVAVVSNNACSGSVVIPANVTSINQYAFQNRPITSLTFAPNSSLTTIGSGAFLNHRLTALELPASLISISAEAFANTAYFTSLTSLTFEAGSQLRTIGGGAFLSANLTSISLPDSLVTLDDYALNGNPLSTVSFGSQLTRIGVCGLCNTNLTSVSLPASLVTLDGGALRSNDRLTSVTFGAGSLLTTIGNKVWDGSAEMSVVLPASVTSIGTEIFGRNSRVTIDAANPNYTIENGVLFNKARTTLISYATWRTDSTYVIPATVTSLHNEAFKGSQLQTMHIPATVLTMGTDVFRGTTRLTEFTFASNSPLTQIPGRAFQQSALPRIEIPARVAVIAPEAFYLSSIQQVTFAPNSVITRIDHGVFVGSSLTSFEIPATVQEIGEGVFFRSIMRNLTFAPGSQLRIFSSIAIRDSEVTSITFPTTPIRNGYRFTGWSNTENGSLISNPATEALAGRWLYAVWEQLSTVTFNSNSGSAVEPVIFSQGDTISAPVAPTRSGYAFEGWSLTNGGTAITLPFQTTSSASINLYANWRVIPTITTGSVTNSQVVSIPSGLTAAEVPATVNLPKVSLAFTATSSSAVVTLVPIDNPAAASATPFKVTGTTKIVDIQVSGISGAVTVCLDGDPTEDIFHFTGGAWVALPDRTYVNGQVCGVTTNFSPFAAAEPRALTPVASSGPSGPRLTLASRLAVTTNGQSLALKGVQLSEIFSVKLDGKDIKVIKQTDGELVVELPAGAEGFPTLELKHSSGTLTYYKMIQVIKPYALTRSIKITKFVGSRPTLAGLSALYKVYRADMSVNVLTCVITVASDASREDISNAEALGKSTCQRVVNYSRQIKNAQIVLKKDGAAGSKPVVEITFDRTLSAVRG